ncbi:hypothetical protein [Chthonobacter rhizosphaerae]|uniref:hypothetical protein n=1 Tax=Chthonobacter rhizosphaerae TaxID=2735553 RepID=UPI0015EF9887|nr:hypothetical protein [Chthonobacter rhizosphaerae]
MSASDVIIGTRVTRHRPFRSGLSDRSVVLSAAAAALLVALLPLAAADMLPLFDYPNHLARIDAMNRFAETQRLQDHYRFDSLLIPNVLSDIILMVLAKAIGAEAAGRILVSAIFGLTFGGIVVLNRVAFGRLGPFGLLAAIFLTNEMMFWGFLNYMLGLAILPWGLAAWLALDRRPAWQRLAAGAAFSLVIFFAHLVAFGLFAIAIAVVELVRAWRHRFDTFAAVVGRLIASALQFAPTIALYLAISPSSGLPLDPRFDFSTWGKFSPFSRVLSSGNPEMDTPVLLCVLGLVAVGLLSRRLRIDLGLGLVALVFAGLVLVLPYSALGSFFLDARVVIAAAFMAIASLGPTWRLGRTGSLLASAAILVLLGARTVVLVDDWAQQGERLREIREAFEAVPDNALVVGATGHHFELGDWTATRRAKPAHEHTAGYAALDRGALVPNLFARAGQNPLVFAPTEPGLRSLDRNPIPRLFRPEDYDWVAGTARAAAEEAAAAGRPFSGAYVIAFYRTCAEWPTGLQVRPVECGSDYSLVEVTSPDAAVRKAAR